MKSTKKQNRERNNRSNYQANKPVRTNQQSVIQDTINERKAPDEHLQNVADKPEDNSHYDVRIAAQTYSNIATVVAGFAFAAVVLVVQNGTTAQSPSIQANVSILRNWSSVAFLVAFFGCILSAFTFAVVSGEQSVTPRANTVAFLAGVGFSISIGLVFWALVILLKTLFVPEVTTIVRQILPIILAANPLFLILTVIDIIIMFDKRYPTRTEYVFLFVIGYLPFAAIFISFVLLIDIAIIDMIFKIMIWLSIAVIMMSIFMSMYVSNKKSVYKLRLGSSMFWIFLNSVVLSVFILIAQYVG